jgi:very-short-patch-repair endonuclease
MANERARQLRKSMTRQEVRLWARLRGLREIGFHFRRQSPIGGYIVDFECRKARLIVELDGGQHNRVDEAARDKLRDVRLEELGYLTLRFWNHEIDSHVDGVLHVIHAILLDRAPHPAASRPPSPEGEGDWSKP